MIGRMSAALAGGLLGAGLLLAGCTSNAASGGSPARASSTGQDHSGHNMDHPADGGPVPAGMTAETSPKYPVGTKVTLVANHLDGMNGAPATIVGAYDTYTYSVNYTPTTNSRERVTDHRWVVHEEIKDAGDKRIFPRTGVTLAAAHAPGMEGAQGTIASVTDETVYVVDFEAGGMTMTNHKWVVESEIGPAQ